MSSSQAQSWRFVHPFCFLFASFTTLTFSMAASLLVSQPIPHRRRGKPCSFVAWEALSDHRSPRSSRSMRAWNSNTLTFKPLPKDGRFALCFDLCFWTINVSELFLRRVEHDQAPSLVKPLLRQYTTLDWYSRSRRYVQITFYLTFRAVY